MQSKKNYFFSHEGSNYFLYYLTRPEQEVKILCLLNEEMVRIMPYPKIIKNEQNQFVSMFYGKPYALIQFPLKNRYILDEDVMRRYYYPIAFEKYQLLNHSNWTFLWSRKIDYFEYQKNYIEKKYPTLYYSMDYYIGYAEVAISYLEEGNKRIEKKNTDVISIAHRRVKEKELLSDFYNPFSLVLDYKVRDLAEYLKSVFFDGFEEKRIIAMIEKSVSSDYEKHLLMARVLFPSFYFDVYEDIINGYQEEKAIYPILEKSYDYEDFLQFIYDTLKEEGLMIKIDFLEKKGG